MLTYRQKPCPSRRQHRRDSQTLQNRQTKQSETLGQQIRGVVMWSFTTLNGLSTSPSEQITTITYKCQLRLLIQPVSAKNPFDTPLSGDCATMAHRYIKQNWLMEEHDKLALRLRMSNLMAVESKATSEIAVTSNATFVK